MNILKGFIDKGKRFVRDRVEELYFKLRTGEVHSIENKRAGKFGNRPIAIPLSERDVEAFLTQEAPDETLVQRVREKMPNIFPFGSCNRFAQEASFEELRNLLGVLKTEGWLFNELENKCDGKLLQVSADHLAYVFANFDARATLKLIFHYGKESFLDGILDKLYNNANTEEFFNYLCDLKRFFTEIPEEYISYINDYNSFATYLNSEGLESILGKLKDQEREYACSNFVLMELFAKNPELPDLLDQFLPEDRESLTKLARSSSRKVCDLIKVVINNRGVIHSFSLLKQPLKEAIWNQTQKSHFSSDQGGYFFRIAENPDYVDYLNALEEEEAIKIIENLELFKALRSPKNQEGYTLLKQFPETQQCYLGRANEKKVLQALAENPNAIHGFNSLDPTYREDIFKDNTYWLDALLPLLSQLADLKDYEQYLVSLDAEEKKVILTQLGHLRVFVNNPTVISELKTILPKTVFKKCMQEPELLSLASSQLPETIELLGHSESNASSRLDNGLLVLILNLTKSDARKALNLLFESPRLAEKLNGISALLLGALFSSKKVNGLLQFFSQDPDLLDLLENPESELFDVGSAEEKFKRILEKQYDIENERQTIESILTQEASIQSLETIPERIYQRQKVLGGQAIWQTWNTFTAVDIACSVFEEPGILNLEKLAAIREDLCTNPAFQNPELGAHRKDILYFLDAIIENRGGLLDALEAVQEPLGRPCFDEAGNLRYRSQAARMIRTILGLQKSEPVTALHAQRAVLSGFLSRIRQHEVGSCFATCFAIMLQQGFPARLVKEMAYLIRHDHLPVDTKENIALINTSGARTPLDKVLRVDLNGNYIDCSKNADMRARTGHFAPLYEFPSILAAVQAMGIEIETAKTLLQAFTKAHAGEQIKIKDILSWIIEEYFPHKSPSAKRRRYEKGKMGFLGTMDHPLMRSLEYTFASLFSRRGLAPILEKIETDPIAFIESYLPNLAKYKDQYQEIPGFREAFEKTLTRLPFIPYWEANPLQESFHETTSDRHPSYDADDIHYLGYTLLDGKFLRIDELTEDILLKDIFARVRRVLTADSNLAPDFEISGNDALIDWSNLWGGVSPIEGVQQNKEIRLIYGGGWPEHIFNDIFCTKIEDGNFYHTIDSSTKLVEPVELLKKYAQALKTTGQTLRWGVLLTYYRHGGSINPGIEKVFQDLILVEDIDAWLQETLVEPTEALITPLVSNLNAIKEKLPNIPLMDLNYDVAGNNICYSIIYDPFEKRFQFAESSYDGEGFTVTKIELEENEKATNPYTMDRLFIVPVDDALMEARNEILKD